MLLKQLQVTCKVRLLMAAVSLALLIATPVQANQDSSAVEAVLDTFHQAASEANGDLYFAQMSDDAVFIGTDATERWSKPAFEAFAKPYFDAGRGWTYTPTLRHITFDASGNVAWFDEILDNASYGECRGTGVLTKREGTWKLAQYHLTIPLPNALAKDVVGQIKQWKTSRSEGQK